MSSGGVATVAVGGDGRGPAPGPAGAAPDALAARYDAITLEQLRQRRSAKWRRYPADVVPAWVAEMDFPLAPPVAAALAGLVERGDTGYVFAADLPAAYAAYAAGRDGWAPDPGRVHVLADVLTGIGLALARCTEPGEGVAFLTPSYPPFYAVVSGLGRRVVDVPLAGGPGGGYVLDLDRLGAALAPPDVTALLLCNPHNPTGRVFGRAELAAVAELADRHGVRVVADEVHAPLVYPGHVHTPFAALDAPAARESVTLVSASKGWNVAGLKCALAYAGGVAAWERIAQVPGELRFGTSIAGAVAAEAAFAAGGPWLAQTVGYLDGTRRLLPELLAAHLPGARVALPDATYLAWVDCGPLGLGDDPAAAFLERGRVAVSRGLDFGAAGAGFVRLNFGTPRPILVEAIRRMGTVLASR